MAFTFQAPQKLGFQSPTGQQVDVYKYQAERGGRPVTFREALDSLMSPQGSELAGVFLQQLHSCPLAAYLVEMPPVTQATAATRAFEFVLIDCPELAATNLTVPAKHPFQEELDKPENAAKKVVPLLADDNNAIVVTARAVAVVDTMAYLDMSRMVRRATAAPLVSQLMELWHMAVNYYNKALGDMKGGPVWLNTTSNKDTHWVHIRIDTSNPPRYCLWPEYRDPTAAPAQAAAAPAQAPSAFASPSATAPAPAPAPSTAAAAPAPGFAFSGGGGTAASKPGTGFSFGGAPAPAPAPSTGFAFGGLSASGTSTPSTTSTAPSFSFPGTASTSAAQSAPATTTTTTTTPLLQGAQQQQQSAPGGLFAGAATGGSQGQQGQRERQLFEAEYGNAKLERIHADLMAKFHEDVERHNMQQELLDRSHMELEAAYQTYLEMFSAVAGLGEHWEAVHRAVTLVEGKQLAVESDVAELEVATSAATRQPEQWQMADIQLEQHVSLVEAATLAHDRLNMCLSTIKDLTSRIGAWTDRRMSDDAPMSQVLRVLNAHQHTLEWAQRTALDLEEQTAQLDYQSRTTARLPMPSVPVPTVRTFVTPGAVRYVTQQTSTSTATTSTATATSSFTTGNATTTTTAVPSAGTKRQAQSVVDSARPLGR